MGRSGVREGGLRGNIGTVGGRGRASQGGAESCEEGATIGRAFQRRAPEDGRDTRRQQSKELGEGHVGWTSRKGTLGEPAR